MAVTCMWSFEDPARHALVSDIIRRRSTNPADVRAAVLAGLDLSSAHNVLDLGCGFGFFTEVVARRVAADAEIVGVDACAANEPLFMARVEAAGRSGRFVEHVISKTLDWPDHSFDLVVASYALYFFPDAVPEIARVLTPDGLLLATTHMESSCRDLLRASGLPISDAALLGNILSFSAENGERLLAPWFGAVERTDYANKLVFGPADFNDFLTYLRFKLPLLLPASEPGGVIPKPLSNAIRGVLARGEPLTFEKNDAAFRCRSPRCR